MTTAGAFRHTKFRTRRPHFRARPDIERLEERVFLSHVVTVDNPEFGPLIQTVMSQMWIWPTLGTTVDSRPGHALTTRTSDYRGALDINRGADDAGDPVFAPLAGTVYGISSPCRGNAIEIDHGNGITSRYLHLQDIRPNFRVLPGVIVGTVGNTGSTEGCSTGSHLHFEILVNGHPIAIWDTQNGPQFDQGFPVDSDGRVLRATLRHAVGETLTVAWHGLPREGVVPFVARNRDSGREIPLTGRVDDLHTARMVDPTHISIRLPADMPPGVYDVVWAEAARGENIPRATGSSAPLALEVVAGILSGARTETLRPGESAPVGISPREHLRLLVDRVGNLVFRVTREIREAFNGLMTLFGPSGESLPTSFIPDQGGGALISFANAVPGEYTLAITHYGTPRLARGTLTVESGRVVDPATQPAPPRVFHDAAGESCEEARRLALHQPNKGDDVGAIVPADDIDFYQLTPNTTGKVEVEVVPEAGLTTIAYLHDGCNNRVNSDSSQGDHRSSFRYDVVAGREYFLVEVKSENGTRGQYQLHIRPAIETVNGQPLPEPPQTQIPWLADVPRLVVPLTNGHGAAHGSIDDPGEIDWYEIHGAEAGKLRLVVRGINDDLSEYDIAFRADGGPIDSDSGEDDGEADICFTVGTGEPIGVAVSGAQGRSRGVYDLLIEQPSACPDDDHPDANESPRPIGDFLTDEWNGFVRGRIDPKRNPDDPNEPADTDHFLIPSVLPVGRGGGNPRRAGWMQIEVDQRNSTLIPLLEVSGGHTGSNDGRDGRTIECFPAGEGATINVKVSGLDGTIGPYTLLVRHNVIDCADDHADLGDQSAGAGGPHGTPIELDAHGATVIHATISHPRDRDSFYVPGVGPGKVYIEVVPLSGSFSPFLAWNRSADPPGYEPEGTDEHSGRGQNPHVVIPNLQQGEGVWFRVWDKGDNGIGDYVVYVWKSPGPSEWLVQNEQWHEDSQEIGPFLPPLALDGFGNEQLAAGIDFAGDRDTFRIDAVRTGPLTIQVMPPAGGNDGVDAFVTVYDASGQAILTSHDPAVLPDGRVIAGSTQVTLDATRGETFYIGVTAFDGLETGPYFLNAHQLIDDHADGADVHRPWGTAEFVSTARLLQPPALGMEAAAGAIESVGDRDVFQILSPMRGTLSVDVTATPPGFPTWTGETTGIATIVQGTVTQDAVTAAGRTVRPAGIVPEGDGTITLVADGGALGLALPHEYNDLNIAAATWSDTIGSGVEFDVWGAFGSSHNWGQIVLTDGTSTIQLNFEKPDGDCGDIGGGVNPNFCVFVTGSYQSPYVLFVGPFTENDWHHVAIAPDDNGNLVFQFDGQVIGTLVGQGLVPGSMLQVEVLAAGALDRFAELRVRNVVVHGAPLTPASDPSLDTFIRVYDSHGTLIALDDDGGDGRNSTVSFPAGIFETYFVEVGGYGDNSVGRYQVQVRSDPPPARTIIGPYDRLDGGAFDTERWEYICHGSCGIEEDNRLHRLAAGGSRPHTSQDQDSNFAIIRSRGAITGGVEWEMSGEFDIAYNFGYAELSDGPTDPALGWDSMAPVRFIRVGMNRVANESTNLVYVAANGYVELENLAPYDTTNVEFVENTEYRFRIVEQGGQIRVYMGDTVLARYVGPLASGSRFEALAGSSYRDRVAARLVINNVLAVEEVNLFASEAKPYDDFQAAAVGSSPDPARWNVDGAVHVRSGDPEDRHLDLDLYRDGQQRRAMATTFGKPGGQGIRGFRLNSDRTGGRVGAGDAEAWVGVTNGYDAIRVRWLSDVNELTVEASGWYSDGRSPSAPGCTGLLNSWQAVARWNPGGPGPDETPNGPIEIRENGNNIEVLHDNRVRHVIPNRSILPGTYVEAFAIGCEELNQTFSLQLDDVDFYFDPVPSLLDAGPTLAASSDTGPSDADHITHQITVTFNWPVGPEGTRYQWREGELPDDGSVAWASEWSPPQEETTATVTLPHASVHVFSVRPVSAEGVAGEPSSRGFLVDTVIPAAPANVRMSLHSDPNGDGLTNDPTPTFQWDEPADDHGIAGYVWRLDNGSWRPVQAEPSVTMASLGDGAHAFRVYAVDLAGNNSEVASRSFVVDAVQPVVTVMLVSDTGVSPTDLVTRDGRVRAEGSEGALLVKVDDNLVIPDEAGIVTVTGDGPHRVVATTTDAAGNVATATLEFTLDTTAPTVEGQLVHDTGRSGSDKVTNDGRVALNWNEGTATVTVDESPVSVPQARALALTGDAVHSVVLSASDIAGNTANTVLQFTLDTTPPVVSTELLNDTGRSREDRVTRDGRVLVDGGDGMATFRLDGKVVTPEPVLCVAVADAPCPDGVVTASGDWPHEVAVSSTDLAGNSAQTLLPFTLDTTLPAITARRSPEPNRHSWNNSPVTVSYDCTDGLAGMDIVSDPETIATEGRNQSGTGICTDVAGNTSSVPIPGINIDLTPPAITATRSPQANAHGWNNTSVTVSYGCADTLSGVDAVTLPQTVRDERFGQSRSGTCSDLAGNVAEVSVRDINIDLSAPFISGTSDRAPNDRGWHNAPVTVSFTCSDEISGVASCSDPVTLGEGKDQAAIGRGTDRAGNEAQAIVTDINVDQTPPRITARRSPPPNANGWINTDVTVTFECTDDLSGVNAGTAGQTVSSEGSDQSRSGTCTDRAGNVAEVIVSGIHIDKASPVMTATRTPAPNEKGWNNSDVTVSFLCVDELSGVLGVSPAQTLTAEGSGQAVRGTCSDLAENSVSMVVSGINIDKTPPILSNVPPDIVVEAPSREGTPVFYTSPAVSDNLDTDVTVSCAPESGRVFPLRETTVSCTAADDADNVARASFNITVQPVNRPPQIDPVADQCAGNEGSLISIGIPATDGDVPANKLTFALELNSPADSSIDPDTGVFTWIPGESDGPGTYPVSVRVTDSGTPPLSAMASFSCVVREVNEPPVLVPVEPVAMGEETLLTIALTATDADLPPNTLRFSLQDAPVRAVVDASSGTVTWTPSEEHGPGRYTLTACVTDTVSPPQCAETLIEVREVNVAPVLGPIGEQHAAEGNPLSFTVTVTDPDRPSNLLSFRLEGMPEGARFDPATHAFTWVPAEAQGPGSYRITIQVTDSGNPPLSNSETITITVGEVNAAPMLAPIGPLTVDELSNIILAVTAEDLDIPTNTLRFSLGPGAPEGVSINSVTGEFRWTPSEEQGPGNYAVTVRATDNGSPEQSDAETFHVTVREVNRPPVLEPIGPKLVRKGDTLTFTATATDLDLPPDTLRFSLAGPAGAVIDAVSGVFAWTPGAAGSSPVTIRVSDNGQPPLSDTETFSIIVEEVRRGSLSGQVFADLNGTSLRDVGEPALAGWSVFLDTDVNGILNPGEPAVVTDSSGHYAFLDLRPGTYEVAEVVKPGYTRTFPTSGGTHFVTIGTDSWAVDGIDFGNRPAVKSSLAVRVGERLNVAPEPTTEDLDHLYEYTAIAEGVVTIQVFSPHSEHTWGLELRDAAGTLLAASTGTVGTQRVDVRAARSEVFQIRVFSLAVGANTYDLRAVNAVNRRSGPSTRELFIATSGRDDVITVGEDALGSGTGEVQDLLLQSPRGRHETRYDVSILRSLFGPEPYTDLLVRGRRGNDRIVVDPSVHLRSILLGNMGNDTLVGGPGDDLLDGGIGTDTCQPGGGRNVTKNCEAIAAQSAERILLSGGPRMDATAIGHAAGWRHLQSGAHQPSSACTPECFFSHGLARQSVIAEDGRPTRQVAKVSLAAIDSLLDLGELTGTGRLQETDLSELR